MTQQPYYPAGPQAPYPGQPAVYTQPPAPAQQHPQYPQYPGYPQQQGYAPPAAQPAPAQPLAQGSIDDYYSQPSTGGGAGLKFTGPNNQPMIGQSYVMQVARPITNGDIQQQTDNQGRPLSFRDGRPKFVMIVPVQLLEPSPNHPDGLAKWYVKGAARDELARAMAEAGAPEGPPEHGAVIRVTLTGTRQSGPGMNPAHVFAVQYVRPQGAAPVQPAAAPATPAAAPAPEVPAAPSPVAGAPQQQAQVQQYAPSPQAPVQELPQQAYAPGAPPIPPAQQYAPQQVQQQVPAPVQPQPTQEALQPPAGLSLEQQEFLARLKQQQQQG